MIAVSSADFAANPGKYLSQAHRAKVIITHHGRFFELSCMEPAKEAELIKAGIQAMYEAGELSDDGPGVPVDVLLEELRGHAT